MSKVLRIEKWQKSRVYVSGVLAQDRQVAGIAKPIAFFPGAALEALDIVSGKWRHTGSLIPVEITEFSPTEWDDIYSHKPPAPGKAIEVELEI